MLRIGLTGGIGSGKSTIATLFEILDVPVFYADRATKALYSSDKELINQLKNEFGEDLYSGTELNRSFLASVVFKDPARLKRLNEIVHPRAIEAADQWMKEQTAPYIIKEAALIFESGSGEGLDYVIGVFAPKSLRIKRVMERDGISREDVLNRMNRQIDENIKMRLCDFVITNDEQQGVIRQVLELDGRLRAMSYEL